MTKPPWNTDDVFAFMEYLAAVWDPEPPRRFSTEELEERALHDKLLRLKRLEAKEREKAKRETQYRPHRAFSAGPPQSKAASRANH